MVPKPYDMAYSFVKNINGIYSACAISGVMAAGLAAAAEIWQFRWTSTTKLAFIKHIHFHAAVDTTGFTAGTLIFNLFKATAFTVAGTGGGTLTLTGNNGKMKTTGMPASAVAEIRVATTAALGAGTKTLLDTAHSTIVTGVGTAAGQDLLNDHELTHVHFEGDHPIVLEANEGIVIQATVPATGTWKFGVESIWEEGETR